MLCYLPCLAASSSSMIASQIILQVLATSQGSGSIRWVNKLDFRTCRRVIDSSLCCHRSEIRTRNSPLPHPVNPSICVRGWPRPSNGNDRLHHLTAWQWQWHAKQTDKSHRARLLDSSYVSYRNLQAHVGFSECFHLSVLVSPPPLWRHAVVAGAPDRNGVRATCIND